MSKSIMIEVDETTKSILELLENKMTNGVKTGFQSFKQENNSALQGLFSHIQIQIQDLGKSLTKENVKVGRKVDDLLNDIEGQLEELMDVVSDTKKEQVDSIQLSINSLKDIQNERFDTIRSEIAKEVQIQAELINQSILEMEHKWEALHTQFQEKISKTLLQHQDKISKLADKQTLVELIEKVADKQSIIGLEKRLADKQSLIELEERLADKQSLVELGEKIADKQSLIDLEEKLANKQSLFELGDKLAHKEFLIEMDEKLMKQIVSELTRMESDLNVKQDVKSFVKKLEHIEKELAWVNQPFYKKWFGKRG